MSDFDYDVFGEEPVEEVKKVVGEKKETVKPKVTPKKAAPKAVKASAPKPKDDQYDIFGDSEPAKEEPVKEAPVKKANFEQPEEDYAVFNDEKPADGKGEYYDSEDGGYQDEGGSSYASNRKIQSGEVAGLATAAVVGAAISKSNKVPKSVKNAINPNYQNEKKQREQEQFLNARREKQKAYEKKMQANMNSGKKPIYRRWWFWLILGLLLLSLIGACFGGDDTTDSSETTTIAEETTTTTTTTVKTYTMDELEVRKDETDGGWYAYAGNEKALSYTGLAKNDLGLWYVVNGKVDFSKTGTEIIGSDEYIINGGKAELKTTTTKPTTSLSQRNALNKANDYLAFTAFSEKGLVKQLEYEGFSNADATWAAKNCGADWNEQAYKKAKEYLDFTSFSHSSLVDQLEYEGFTTQQAEYGVNKVGL